MRIAALYDVHGNLPALEAVLRDVERERVDLVVSGGDVVWGPRPAACLELLAALGERARFVLGNADRDVLEAADEQSSWCREQLGEEQRRRIASWSATVVADGVLFCHASPRSDTESLTGLTPDAYVEDAVAGAEQPLVVCGHTHAQFDRRVGGVRVVNAGSIGLPYEGEAAAFWALLGPDVELRRTTYDVAGALPGLLASGFPRIEELLHPSLVEPLSPDEAARRHEARAGRAADC